MNKSACLQRTHNQKTTKNVFIKLQRFSFCYQKFMPHTVWYDKYCQRYKRHNNFIYRMSKRKMRSKCSDINERKSCIRSLFNSVWNFRNDKSKCSKWQCISHYLLQPNNLSNVYVLQSFNSHFTVHEKDSRNMEKCDQHSSNPIKDCNSFFWHGI